MTPSEREEIFDPADDAVCAGEMEYWDKYKNKNGTKGFKTKHQCIIEHVRQAILTQVAKAKKEAYEECAKICDSECRDCRESKKYGTYRCAACVIGKSIRNKLEKE